MAKAYGLDGDIPEEFYPLQYKQIQKQQQKDEELIQKLKENPKYSLKVFRGGGKERTLIVKDNKIVLPKTLQQRAVQWYHQQLCHPGMTRTEATISQHFTFKGLKKVVADTCSKCPTCQKCKRTHVKYGHLPEKDAEADPWEKLCVDLIGLYTIKQNKRKAL